MIIALQQNSNCI